MPISWTVMDAYASRHGITGDDYDDLLYFLTELDSAYLQHLRKKGRIGGNA